MPERKPLRIVHTSDVHHGSKSAGFDGEASTPAACDEALVEWDGLCGGQRTQERRPPSFAGIGVERELTDDEQRATRITQRAVDVAGLATFGDAAGRVRKQSHSGDSVDEEIDLFGSVALADAEQHAQPGRNLPEHFA